MQTPAALEVALTLVERPASVRWASQMPLPAGVTLVLEVAAGDFTALNSAQRMTKQPEKILQLAAGFFIEQVLFVQGADSYRILGCSSTSARKQLRRHMALLVKWLHPDHHEPCANGIRIDRSIFVHRVTRAWEDLKNDERRAAYDRLLHTSAHNSACLHDHQAGSANITAPRAFIFDRSARRRPPPRLIMHQIRADTLISRLLHFLRRHP